MRRTTDYDEQLSRELRDPEFAREFLMTLVENEEGLSPEEALWHTFKRMGIKEAAEMTGEAAPNIVAYIKGKRRPNLETLNKLLKPFGLAAKTVMVVLREAS